MSSYLFVSSGGGRYPVPGFRDTGYYGKNGTLMNVGSNGCSWSAAASGSGAVYLDFSTTHLNPSYAYYRTGGLQVRCLQE